MVTEFYCAFTFKIVRLNQYKSMFDANNGARDSTCNLSYFVGKGDYADSSSVFDMDDSGFSLLIRD